MSKKSLAFAVVVLFVGASVVSAFNVNSTNDFKPMNRGNWLYVGGIGEGNYTKIQDAINDSVDGDTVFVYDDLSPYLEAVVVDKSINLVGEDKYSTVIDGFDFKKAVISINVDGVLIQGFTIQNATESYGANSAVAITSNNNSIVDNILQFSSWAGVSITFGDNNVIQENIIRDNSVSGVDILGKFNMVINNYIVNNRWGGVILEGAFNTNVSFNTIQANDAGIELLDFNRNNTFYQNNITNNKIGIDIMMSSMNYVIQNNFINNNINARFARCLVAEFFEKFIILIFQRDSYILKNYKEIGSNFWDGNYWNKSHVLPYPILGRRGLFGTIITIDNQFLPNRIAFDWHPAKEPYNIGG